MSTTRFAWVYLLMLGDDYVKGLLPACYSMKKLAKTNYDCVCMITNDVSEEAKTLLLTIFDRLVDVEYLTINCKPMKIEKQRVLYNSWINKSCTKWNCLLMTEYEKVIFMDADTIIIKNMDHLFELNSPAGTFSTPWSEQYTKRKGIYDPYKEYNHGDVISFEIVNKGLNSSSFVVIATTILLTPNKEHHALLKSIVDESVNFGFNCYSGHDEQMITYLFNNILKQQFTFIHQAYNFIPWHREWLLKTIPKNKVKVITLDMLDENDNIDIGDKVEIINNKPYLLHYFGKKNWNTVNRNEWFDLEPWWQIVDELCKDENIKKLYPETEKKMCCFWCNTTDHNLIEIDSVPFVSCPLLE